MPVQLPARTQPTDVLPDFVWPHCALISPQPLLEDWRKALFPETF
jgi:hypothetical protein